MEIPDISYKDLHLILYREIIKKLKRRKKKITKKQLREILINSMNELTDEMDELTDDMQDYIHTYLANMDFDKFLK